MKYNQPINIIITRQDKKRYLEKLVQKLHEYYDERKLKSDEATNHQHYIIGYLNAATDLNIFSQKELKATIDEAHFKAFGKTIEEKQKDELSESSADNDVFNIPAYIREGIKLDKG
jgi:hypothetical protein